MQQYIYGNINKKGFCYSSSEPSIINLPDALVSYDTGCVHGGLSGDEHRCYWMAAVNIGTLFAPDPRLVFQASGWDVEHFGICVQGFMNDKGQSEEEIYGEPFLRLLRAEFHRKIVAAADQGTPEEIALENIRTDETLRSAEVNSSVLCYILQELLNNRKVYVRLSSTGAEAMRQSRELLLAIYERLPYERRKNNGFLTGASISEITKIKGKLPISIILIDGDTSVNGLTDPVLNLKLDLKASLDEKLAQTTEESSVIRFLAEEPVEKLEEFFQFCREFSKPYMTLAEYQLLLDGYRLRDFEFVQEQIFCWAERSIFDCWDPLREELYKTIAKQLKPHILKDELLTYAQHFDDLSSWNVPVSYARNEENAGRNNLLRLTDILWNHYSTEEQNLIVEATASHFVELECRECPYLTAKKPDKETKLALEKLPLPKETNDLELVKRVKERVSFLLTEKRDEIRSEYERQLREQKKHGLEQIEAWYFLDNAGNVQKLDGLYNQLKAHYLYQELILENASESNWNDSIAKVIIDCLPKTLRDEKWVEQTRKNLQYFEENQGVFSGEQKKVISAWEKALELKVRDRDTVPQLKKLLDEIRSIERYCWKDVPPKLLDEPQVQKWASEQYADNIDLLLLLAPKSTTLRNGIVSQLAQRPNVVSADEIRELYIAGCSKECLRNGAGASTAESWASAVGMVFPELPDMPENLMPVEGGKWLILIESLLMSLVGIFPAVYQLMDDSVTMRTRVVLIAVLAILSVFFGISGAVLSEKTLKRLMLGLSVAFLPGIVFAIIMLVLSI